MFLSYQQVVLAKVFDLKCTVQQITTIGDPIIEYEQSETAKDEGGEVSAPASSQGGDEEGSAAPSKPTHHAQPSTDSTSGAADTDETQGDTSASSTAATAAHRKSRSSTSSLSAKLQATNIS